MRQSNKERGPACLIGQLTTEAKSACAAAQGLRTGLRNKALSIAEPFLTIAARELVVLDVGCGYGFTTVELAKRCRHVVGIEPSAVLFESARRLQETCGLRNVEVRRASAADLVEEKTFDLALLDNVLEHIADQSQALDRISTALKPGGAVVIIVPNKLWPLEVHYGLPFLSYLPLPLANRYLRLTRRGKDYSDASYAPPGSACTACLLRPRDCRAISSCRRTCRPPRWAARFITAWGLLPCVAGPGFG